VSDPLVPILGRPDGFGGVVTMASSVRSALAAVAVDPGDGRFERVTDELMANVDAHVSEEIIRWKQHQDEKQAYVDKMNRWTFFGKQYAHPLDEPASLVDDAKRRLWLGRHSRRARIRELEKDLRATYAELREHRHPGPVSLKVNNPAGFEGAAEIMRKIARGGGTR
jgi:hypothetical protein